MCSAMAIVIHNTDALERTSGRCTYIGPVGAIENLVYTFRPLLCAYRNIFVMMSSLGMDLKAKEDFEDASSTAPTPMERSTTNSMHDSEKDPEKDRSLAQDGGNLTKVTSISSSIYPAPAKAHGDGGALTQVESSMYPGPAKLIPIFIAIILSMFLVALDMTSE